MNKRAIGAHYEERAADYLKRAGYQILARNFRNRTGEIDIVARDGEYLVFVEVKYRADGACGSPLEAVDYRKQRNIVQTARAYMLKHGCSTETCCRFDVLAIEGERITLVRNAFGA